ncbi:MAG: response regulator [Gammaproteobacteria bacterium]|nr:response regulator [Gammaproteobacteria bacterium]
MTTEDREVSALFHERLSAIRHDLRTPVGHILGYAEILLEENEGDLSAEQAEDLRQIQHGGERLLNLIDDYLGANKRSVGELDLAAAQHGLRTQLTHISGYCEMLEEIYEDDDPHELMPDIGSIGSATRNLMEQINRELTPGYFSRADQAAPSADSAESLVPEPPAVADQLWLGGHGRILVVDDSEANRDLFQRRLGKMGYDALVASCGSEMFGLLDREKVDLILLDMVMPDRDGLDLLGELKRTDRLKHLPVMMLSALDDNSRVVQSILAGAEDYILKPPNPVLLRARLGACLEKYRLRQQQGRPLKVFISSPGDVIPERRLCRSVLTQLNAEYAGQLRLIPVLWEEEPLQASDTFQAQIISPKETDIYIGIFWSRLGSPLPEQITRADGSRYLSGSEYEFEEAIEGNRESGSPELLFYRKTAPAMVELDNRTDLMQRLEQKERLEAFVQRWFMDESGASYIGAFHGFDGLESFEALLLAHLRKLLDNRLAAQ